MTAITDWLPKVRGSILGAPNTVLKAALISTLRDFCRRSKLWYEELTTIDIVDETSAYALTSSNGDIVDVEHVEIDDIPLLAVTEEYLDKNEYGWRAMTAGTPLRYYTNVAREINLVYIPSADNDDSLAVWVNLMPAEDDTTVEDFLWEDWWQVISHGAKAELFAMTAMPWGDVKLAGEFGALYNQGVELAATFKESGFNSETATLEFGLE